MTDQTKEAWTPGPWHFLEAHDHDDEYSSCHPLTICSDDNDDLASIFSAADSTVSIPREQAVANAFLIQAATDMYAALLHAQANMPHQDQMIDAALKKARGEQC